MKGDPLLYFSDFAKIAPLTRTGPEAGGTGSTTPTFVGPKLLPFMVKAFIFLSVSQTNANNRLIDTLLRWSDLS